MQRCWKRTSPCLPSIASLRMLKTNVLPLDTAGSALPASIYALCTALPSRGENPNRLTMVVALSRGTATLKPELFCLSRVSDALDFKSEGLVPKPGSALSGSTNSSPSNSRVSALSQTPPCPYSTRKQYATGSPPIVILSNQLAAKDAHGGFLIGRGARAREAVASVDHASCTVRCKRSPVLPGKRVATVSSNGQNSSTVQHL